MENVLWLPDNVEESEAFWLEQKGEKRDELRLKKSHCSGCLMCNNYTVQMSWAIGLWGSDVETNSQLILLREEARIFQRLSS